MNPATGSTTITVATQQELSNQAQALLENTLSANTKSAYKSGLKRFDKLGGTIPATPNQVAEIVAQCDYKPATLSVMLSAVAKAHKLAGHLNPCDSELVKSVLQGYRRAKTMKQRRAKPLFSEDVARMVKMDSSNRAIRDNALLLVGFVSAMRKSELLSLNIEDVEVCQDGSGFYITLAKSKTDPEGLGHVFHIPNGKTSLCPAQALEKLLTAMAEVGITTGALFRRVSRGDNFIERLTTNSVSLIFKRMGHAVGFDANTISGHSTRRGAISTLDRMNVPRKDIRRLSRHKSDRMIDLYSEDKEMTINPFSGLL